MPTTESNWLPTLSAIGLATVSYIAYKFTRQAIIYLLPSQLSRYNQSSAHPNWALVTGATDGIGFGFCEELCSRGFNVILHGRNREKLVKRAQELRAAFPDRQTDIVVLDVVGMDENSVEDVARQVRGMIGAKGEGKLSLLVNNVGGETRPAVTLETLTYADVNATIDKNARFMAQMTRVLLPLLSEGHGSRKSGLVLNVSSASQYGLPYISVYSGTKGFVETFTRALEAECRAEGLGVDVMALRVAQVKTPGYDVESNLFIPQARTLAKAGLDRVGCGEVVVWAYFWHWLQGLAFEVMPRRVLMQVSVKAMMTLKKKEEERALKRQ